MAVPATVIMLLQTILLLIGMGNGAGGDSSDADGSFDGEIGDSADGSFDGEVGDSADGGFDGEIGDSADGFDGEIGGGTGDFDGEVGDSAGGLNGEIGHDSYGPTNGGSDGGLKLFTVRTIVAFFMVGGWTGTAMLAGGKPEAAAIPVAFLAGTAAVFAIALLFKYSLRLQDNGAVLIQNTLGKQADVYLYIPEGRKGKGKITVLVQERYREYDAVTNASEPIKTGDKVVVTGIADEQTVIVKRTEA